jgi:Ca2+-binding RTX toxin-like protein
MDDEITTITKNGVIYQIHEAPGAGFSKEEIKAVVNNLHTQCSYTSWASELASDENPIVKIYIDPDSNRLMGGAGGGSGSGTYKVDGDNFFSVVINSSDFSGSIGYKVPGYSYPGGPYVVPLVDVVLFHEIKHIQRYRIDGYDPDTDTEEQETTEEAGTTTYDNHFAGGLGIAIRDGHELFSVPSGVTPYNIGPFIDPKIYERSPSPCIEQVGTIDPYGAGESTGSPLVMDIDGDGVELISLASSNVFFDVDSAKDDGFAENTGWVDADDGLLAIDLNADGIINNSNELFGDQTGFTNGFLALAAYDLNDDGVINSGDAVFTELRVWMDENTNGYSEYDELHTMDDLLITEIDLGYSDVGYQIDGNDVLQESTFIINGNTRDIVDAYFSYDNINTKYNEIFFIDPASFDLPTARGYGNIPNLHIAVSIDNDDGDPDSLISLVTDLNNLNFSDIFDETTDVLEDVQDIMFRWAGVDGVDPSGRGLNIDGRVLSYLEKFTGRDFLQHGIWSNPGPFAAEELKEGFHGILVQVYANLLAQSAAGELLEGDLSYNIAENSFEDITGLNISKLNDLETEATGLANTGQRQVFWENVVRMIEYTIGTANLDGGDLSALQTAITDSDATLDLEDDILPALDYSVPFGSTYNGTSGTDTLNGSSDNDEINGFAGTDTLSGLGGNDEIDGGADADTIDGGTGQDYLIGDLGDDTYLYDLGDGDDTIKERNTGAGNNADKIVFGSGIDLADLTITRMGNTALLIEIDTGAQTGQIIIEDQFNYSAGGGHVETLDFVSDPDYSLASFDYTLNGTAGNDFLEGVTAGGDDDDTINGLDGNDTIQGEAGDDILSGGDGNDTIDGGGDNDTITGGGGNDEIDAGTGNDSIDAGAGDDEVEGNTGDDTFIYVSGNDTYSESSGTDSIDLDPTWTAAGTQYFRIGNDMQIWFDASNSITIPGFFASAGNKIETLDFHVDTDVNLTTVSTVTQGTSGNDTIGGTANPDTIFGFGGNDTLNGGSGSNGADIVYGGTGDDTMTGGAGNDSLYGEAGDDDLDGGNDNDYLDGGAGDDIMEGGNGDDHYFFVSGDDNIDELAGTEILEMSSAWAWEDLSFRRYVAATADLVIEIDATNSILIEDQFTGQPVETVRMNDGSGDHTMTSVVIETHGDNNNNTISAITTGGSTNNVIYGFNGTDTLNGNTGNDSLYGGDGTDTINASSGNDTIDGGDGNDTLNGAAGDDTYYFYAGGDLDTASEGGLGGADTLWITGGVTINDITVANLATLNTKVTVTASVDELTITNQRHSAPHEIETIKFDDGFTASLNTYNLWLKGTSGNDIVAGAGSNDVLIGYAGTDTMTGSGGTDNVHGGSGNDSIDGGTGADVLYGGTGDDTIIGGTGNDTMVGGDGTDTADYSSDSAAVTVSLSTGTATDGASNSDTLSGFENITGSAYNDTLIGDVSANTLTGGGGTDTLTGNGGNDILHGGAGNDTMDGGFGVDRVWYAAEASGVTVNLGTGSATDGSSNTDSISNVENVTGSAYNDTITGDGNANDLSGGAGVDSLTGADGNDTLKGGTGNDTLNGGNDTDTADYSEDGAGVAINLSSGTATDGGGGSDTLSNIENARGSAFNDTLTGSSSANDLYGGAGVDTINANAGADSLYGEDGADTMDGGDDADVLSGGAGADVMNGGNGADTLYGGNDGDTLDGDADGDVLFGEDGLDTLWGDGGNDRFGFTNDTAFNDIDVIKDFNISSQEDMLDISNILFMNGYEDGVDTLTDWVQITDSGSDSVVKIDVTGTATFGGGTQIATLESITGLTDEAALKASGNLIVA